MTAATLALVMALTIVPVSALPRFAAKAEVTTAWTVPEGYNAHDYIKCVEFLEQTDANGVKNGKKLSSNYNPNNPSTWGEDCFEWTTVNGEKRVHIICFYESNLCGSLNLSGCTALFVMECYSNNFTELDLSGCTALDNLTKLDVTGCSKLETLYCSNNNLTELDVTGCPKLTNLACRSNELTELDVTGCSSIKSVDCAYNNLAELNVTGCIWLYSLNCKCNNLTELDVTQNTALAYLYCYYNNLTELDVTGCTNLVHLDCRSNNLTELNVTQNTVLRTLDCRSNKLTELDVTQNTALADLHCHNNNLTELDLSNNTRLTYDYIRAEGSGFIGYRYDRFLSSPNGKAIFAYTVNGAVFEGFYAESGELISEGEWNDELAAYCYDFSGTPTGTVIARFSGGFIPGDTDGDGEVSAMDALLLMRFCVGEIGADQLNLESADVNGDGVADLRDAIIVLRMTLGLA